MTSTITQQLVTKTLKEMRAEGIPQVEWRIDKIVPKRGAVILGGTSGSFKTWTGMQMALACASGTPFLGYFQTEPCNVLYIDEENGDITLPFRFDLLIKGHDIKADLDNLHISIFGNVKLDFGIIQKTFKEFIEKYDVKLIVVDSMVRCMNGVENKAEDVRLVFENIKALFKDFQELSIVILHHTKKGGRGMDALRGSGDFAAFADVILMFNTYYNKFINVELVKNRHIDLSTFNKFSIQVIKNKDNNGISLSHQEYKDANMNVIEDCKTDLIDYCKKNETKAFNSGDMWSQMRKLGHKKNTFYDAVNELMDEHHITRKKRGRYEVHICEVQEELVE